MAGCAQDDASPVVGGAVMETEEKVIDAGELANLLDSGFAATRHTLFTGLGRIGAHVGYPMVGSAVSFTLTKRGAPRHCGIPMPKAWTWFGYQCRCGAKVGEAERVSSVAARRRK
jgi:hypothetical protein